MSKEDDSDGDVTESDEEDPKDEEEDKGDEEPQPDEKKQTPQEYIMTLQFPPKKSNKISAAIYKMKFNPEGVQNLRKRLLLYKFVSLMLERRGYKIVQDCDIFPTKLPTPKGFLLITHMHATRTGFEPIYIMFCTQLGDPTLKAPSIRYPSGHTILIYDRITGKAKTAILDEANQKNHDHILLANARTPPPVTLTTGTVATAASIAATTVVAAVPVAVPLATRKKSIPAPPFPFYNTSDVYFEAFEASKFFYDKLEHCYSRETQYSVVTDSKELESIRDMVGSNDAHLLPAMMYSDAIPRYLGLKAGMILRLVSFSSTCGLRVDYRIILKNKPK